MLPIICYLYGGKRLFANGPDRRERSFLLLTEKNGTLVCMASTLRLLTNRRMLSILFLGFSSGIPLALVGSTLQAWMASEKVALTMIGIFSLVNVPYNLKFIWAPLMDRFTLPFLGRRKGWMIFWQAALILTIAGMALCDPLKNPAVLAVLAVLVAFSSSSQDIVVDAYKAEILAPEEFGAGAAVANLGYRLSMLFSGAGALILSDHLPWKTVYLLMAASMSIGLVATLLSPEPALKVNAPKNLKEAVLEPFIEFFSRKGSFEVAGFILLYKLDVVVTLALMTPFFMQLGFTKTDIGAITKGFGLVSVLAGTFAGGVWLSRLGIEKALWVFGVLQGFSGICFYILARLGHNYPMMVTTIAAENFFSGMGNAAYAAFLMTLCNPKYTATQFALLTSLMALTRTLAGAPTGWLAQTAGWEAYFLIAMGLAIPGLALLTRFKKWQLRFEVSTES
jgi:MFS transporter, PAT family, beta-lactamase induction signal transducer AmpG